MHGLYTVSYHEQSIVYLMKFNPNHSFQMSSAYCVAVHHINLISKGSFL